MSTDPKTLIAAARDLYEGTHGMTMSELAEATGIPKRTLTMHSRDQSWAKALETKTGATTAAAAAAAELFRQYQAEPPAPVVETNQAVGVMAEPLPTERDALLARHRKEWAAPRAMSAEAVRIRDTDPFKAMERAKLAKITSETLQIVQSGERKAHGLDLGVDVPQGSVVVIERA